MSDQPPLCWACQTVMADAGPIGFYCPNDACPGRAKSLAWAHEQVERDNPSPNAIAALRAENEQLRAAAVKDQAEIKRLQGLIWKQQPGTRAQRRAHLQPSSYLAAEQAIAAAKDPNAKW